VTSSCSGPCQPIAAPQFILLAFGAEIGIAVQLLGVIDLVGA
jgi:hypothetical protein